MMYSNFTRHPNGRVFYELKKYTRRVTQADCAAVIFFEGDSPDGGRPAITFDRICFGGANARPYRERAQELVEHYTRGYERFQKLLRGFD